MSNSRFIAWAIWVIVSVFYAYQYILRVMPSILMNDIMQRFNIDAAVFGQFSGVYYLGYSLMHLPIGIMLDHYGPRKVMTGCILLTIVGMLPIIFSEHWTYPIIGRILIGVGSSAAILGAFKIIRLTFSEAHFSRMLSFSVTIGLIGAIYGGAPVSYMNKTLGYQAVIEIFAVIGLILAALTYLIVPEIEKENSKASVLLEIKQVLTNKKVILTCIFAGLMVGPLEGFADVWGAEFFRKVYNFDNNVASSLPSMIFIGMCFGAPVLSLIAEKTNNYIGTIVFAGIAMAAIFTILIFNKLSTNAISFSFIIVGICCAYQILAIYKASTYVADNVVGLTTAIANMIIMIFGYFFHSIIGMIIKIYSTESSSEAFIYGIGIIPVALLIGSAGFITLSYKNRKA
ncbi:MAG: MFS transporter [Rickettsiales bacterium]